MAVLGELLFYRGDQVDLDAVLRHPVDLPCGRVDELPDKLFTEKTDEELAAHVAAKYAIEPLKLDLAAAKASVEEVQVKVHDQWGFEPGLVRVLGLRATKSTPFMGEADLWRQRTNSFNLNPPRGDVCGRNLVIGIEVPLSKPMRRRSTSKARSRSFPSTSNGKRLSSRRTTRASPAMRRSGSRCTGRGSGAPTIS